MQIIICVFSSESCYSLQAIAIIPSPFGDLIMSVITQHKIVSYLILLTLTFCLGSTFFFSSLALSGMHPMAVGAGRVVLGGVFLTLVALISGKGLVRGLSRWRMAAIYGVIFITLPFLFLPWVLLYLSTTTAAIYYASVPLLVLVLSRVILRTYISWRRWLGFIIGAIGLFVLIRVGADSVFVSKAVPLRFIYLPHLVCLFSAVLLAGGGLYLQSIERMPPLSITASAFIMGNIIALPTFIAFAPTAIPSTTTIIGLVGVGFLASGLGTLIRGILIQREGAIFTSVNGYIAPVYASFLGIIFLGEIITLSNIIAYGLVVIGLFIARP